MNTRNFVGAVIGLAFVAASCGVTNNDTVLPQGVPETPTPTIDEIDEPAEADEPADRETTTTSTTAAPPSDGQQCIVRLHGKGGNGGETSVDDGIRTIRPTGNEEGWGARQWIYFPDDRYTEARDLVGQAIAAEGCAAVVINGFSNGAAFAASLFCNAETFDGVVRGYVIDDPVTDTATEDCARASDVQVVMYWTGDIERTPGTDCASIDWTCAGGTTVDVETYASRMGTSVTPSPFTDHSWYWDAPEVIGFLG